MRQHFETLGWLHVVWGGFGLLVGVSLGMLAFGTHAALADDGPITDAGTAAVGVLASAAALAALAGVAMAATGRALLRRSAAGRRIALGLAVPNLVVVPFGSALGVYTLWALLNDDARAAFGATPVAAPAGDRP